MEVIKIDKLKIRLLNDNDVKLMEVWLKKGHVARWYEHPDDWMAEVKGRNGEFKFIKHFIAIFDNAPIGFCQYYACSNANEDWYGNLPLLGTYSIDYLIGEENYLGRGFGKAIISLLIKEVFSLVDSKRIIVQPEEDNRASCNALLSNGFIFDINNNLYCKTK